MDLSKNPDKMSGQELRLEVKDLRLHLADLYRDTNVTFHQDSEQVGQLWFDREQRLWMFEGDKAKSAVEFVAWLRVTFRDQLKAIYEGERHDRGDGDIPAAACEADATAVSAGEGGG